MRPSHAAALGDSPAGRRADPNMASPGIHFVRFQPLRCTAALLVVAAAALAMLLLIPLVLWPPTGPDAPDGSPATTEPVDDTRGLRLYLGCGRRRIPGFVHIDIDPQPHLAYRHDVRTLPMFANDSVVRPRRRPCSRQRPR